MEDILQALKQLRLALHLTETQVARRVGCSRQSLDVWEHNRVSINRGYLERWLQVLSEEVMKVRDMQKRVRVYKED